MDSSTYERIEQSCRALKVDLSSKEMAVFTEEKGLTPNQLGAVADLFQYLEEKKHQTVIDTLLRLSRLPIKAPKTFANYDFDRIDVT